MNKMIAEKLGFLKNESEKFELLKDDIAAYNLVSLKRLCIAGTVLGAVLAFLSTPFIGVLKLFWPYLALFLLFLAGYIMTLTVLKGRPAVTLVCYYLLALIIHAICIYMGTVLSANTNATTFLLALLLLPLFVTDRTWRLILVNTVSTAAFIVVAYAVKPGGAILSLDISNAVFVYLISATYIVITVRRQLRSFEVAKSDHEELERSNNIINAIPAGIAVFEVRGNIVRQQFTNDGFYRLFEDTREAREKRCGGNFMNSIYPDDRKRLKAAIKSVIDGKDLVTLTCRSMKGDGSYMWVRFSSAVDKREKDYLRVYSTYTSMEEEMKSRQATQAKTDFLSRMSHDIRTPMNAIIGMTHLAQMEDDMPKVREYLEKIDVSSGFLLGLINDILDMSKIESGQLELKPEPYSVSEFEKSVRVIIDPIMQERHIDFVYKMDWGVERLMLDKLRFKQIFFNLLSNAAKYTPVGGRVEFTSKQIPDRNGQHGVRFIVHDNGTGMSDEFMKKLFVPFLQERMNMSEDTPGTGLGLPIVKSLVDAMKGTIDVKSAPGFGTEFIVDLYADVGCEPADAPKAREYAPGERQGDVLLVEDNALNIVVAKNLLEYRGYTVAVAKNGQEAVDAFGASAAGHFIAILMDIRMPVMGGLEAAKHIRAMKRRDAASVPIIALTADAFSEEHKRTLAAGMNAHLIKPVEQHILYDTLDALTRKDSGNTDK